MENTQRRLISNMECFNVFTYGSGEHYSYYIPDEIRESIKEELGSSKEQFERVQDIIKHSAKVNSNNEYDIFSGY